MIRPLLTSKSQMELVLPVQVCREQLYGDAHKNSGGYHAKN